MDRKEFMSLTGLGTGSLISGFAPAFASRTGHDTFNNKNYKELKADLVIAGGGVGGCAAAIAALQNNLSVIMTEETDWIGGQLTQQGVPPDEHPWIETHGSTALYRTYRTSVRDYYRNNYPLTAAARAEKYLNPGDAVVSQLSHEPRVSLAVLQSMLMQYLSNGKLTLLLEHKISAADSDGTRVKSLTAVSKHTREVIGLTAVY
ncbi:MAG: FAD-dependent oxidoreductase, partial [Chitinophagaceae bacterium]